MTSMQIVTACLILTTLALPVEILVFRRASEPAPSPKFAPSWLVGLVIILDVIATVFLAVAYAGYDGDPVMWGFMTVVLLISFVAVVSIN